MEKMKKCEESMLNKKVNLKLPFRSKFKKVLSSVLIFSSLSVALSLSMVHLTNTELKEKIERVKSDQSKMERLSINNHTLLNQSMFNMAFSQFVYSDEQYQNDREDFNRFQQFFYTLVFENSSDIMTKEKLMQDNTLKAILYEEYEIYSLNKNLNALISVAEIKEHILQNKTFQTYFKNERINAKNMKKPEKILKNNYNINEDSIVFVMNAIADKRLNEKSRYFKRELLMKEDLSRFDGIKKVELLKNDDNFKRYLKDLSFKNMLLKNYIDEKEKNNFADFNYFYYDVSNKINDSLGRLVGKENGLIESIGENEQQDFYLDLIGFKN